MKLEPGYDGGVAQLRFPDAKTFRIDFRAGSGWEGFGALEGETTRYGDTLWLLPKRLGGKTESEINAQAMRDAQQLGKQTDLMAVGRLMVKVELTVSKDAKSLKVVEPKENPREPHPLAGVNFGASL